MYVSIKLWIVVLKDVQIVRLSISVAFSLMSLANSRNSVLTACSYLYTGRGESGFLVCLKLNSINLASWLEIPGLIRVWFTKVSLFVRNKSRMLDLVSVILVGSSTIW